MQDFVHQQYQPVSWFFGTINSRTDQFVCSGKEKESRFGKVEKHWKVESISLQLLDMILIWWVLCQMSPTEKKPWEIDYILWGSLPVREHYPHLEVARFSRQPDVSSPRGCSIGQTFGKGSSWIPSLPLSGIYMSPGDEKGKRHEKSLRKFGPSPSLTTTSPSRNDEATKSPQNDKLSNEKHHGP